MTMLSQRRSGFTLIEVLVAIAILGVVTTIGLRSFVLLTGEWKEQRAMMDLHNIANNAFREIERDLSDTLSAELSGLSIRGYDEETPGSGFNAAPDNDDRIVVPVQNSVGGSTLANARSVQWRVVRDVNDINILYRSVGGLGVENPSNGRTPYTERANVVRFDATYATGDENRPWAKSWTADEHPKAVRVSMVLSHPDYPFRQISRKEVFAVHVR